MSASVTQVAKVGKVTLVGFAFGGEFGEAVLEKAFGELLKGITFSSDVLAWVSRALRENHQQERDFHDEAITRLQREHRRIQERIDRMYMDKLDGRIDAEFFDRKAAEFRSEQCRLMRDLEAHQTANLAYIEQGVKLMCY
jgi:site-specific DNA recombinase